MRKLMLTAAFFLSACAAAHEPGWTGQNAMPFDHARATCEIETQTLEGPTFEVCMASKGWTHANP